MLHISLKMQSAQATDPKVAALDSLHDINYYGSAVKTAKVDWLIGDAG